MESKFKGFSNCTIIIIFIFTFCFCSCKKLIGVNPPITATTNTSVFSTDANAASVLTGLYATLSQGGFVEGSSGISLLSGLSADEFTLFNGVSNTSTMYYYYTNTLFVSALSSAGTENWSGFYNDIYTCNVAIEGISVSNSLTPAVQQQLLGEAKFMRAFLYFYLVNLYGPVPLATTSDYEVNSELPRSSISDVYKQIIADLTDAEALLSSNYVSADAITATSERVRPTKWAAAALLARVYLYTGDYADAEKFSTEVIGNTSLYQMTLLDDVFLKNSQEAIWQLQPVFSGINTADAPVFVIPSTGPSSNYPVYLSNSLLNSFSVGDERRLHWVDSVIVGDSTYYFPYKYKVAVYNAPVTEYLMVLRLGEQYLIRGEARVQQGESSAVDDLNVLLNRAGLSNYSGPTDKNSLLNVIMNQRRIELFSEWGNRWLDLKRMGNVDAVMSVACPQKGGTWNSYQQLYPISFSDIERDQNLTQNIGY
ncbi:RagB/SusD family nutrient uptake outer membrane protein [Dinghuibacter silviterrae]|uniref:SusD-like starch-binding protein associating with outer membrane n=1 Tax=Dinghuibacter silviterrae TaxID=1539049 RepID=A0A4R8DUK3_9BACT|nr:RagB/SusD family nutrient uptake outer membrane protein [Dinghuibacter silviterrae]TDX01849.1 SusD-like starch-binding protein associating with outer membrane [Dinghuibacter silviterrae]